MTDSPSCANCFQEVPWTPVYEDGEVYCCDGCVTGGPCICTYDGPPLKLNTRAILEAAGYDLEALAAELSVCANCFEEFTREPVYAKEIAYCCRGCTLGGPCNCTYGEPAEGRPAVISEMEIGGLVRGAFDHAAEMDVPAEDYTPGFLNANSLWQQISQWDDTVPDDDAYYQGRKFNDHWVHRQHDSEANGPAGDVPLGVEPPSRMPQGSGLEADMDLGPVLQSVDRCKTYKVVASPLEEVADVHAFTSALDATPSVESVILTHYSGDKATFEIDTHDLDKVVRELVEGDLHYPVRSFSMSPEGLELLLRSRGGDLLAAAPRSEEASASHFADGPDLTRRSDLAEDGEVGAFKFEMGVDVFFNGRHQVKVRGIYGPVHMHSWRIQATLVGESMDDAGSLVGTQQVKDIITAYVARFNEKLLNKVSPFDEVMPSSNNMARVIYDHVCWEMQGETNRGGLAGVGPVLKSIRLWESPTSYVEYSGDARAA